MRTVNQDVDNLGGTARIVAIAPESFRRIRKNHITGRNYLEIIPDDRVIEIPDSGFAHSLNVEREAMDDGYLYKVSLEGVLQHSPDNEQIAETLFRGTWIVLSVDSLGNGIVFGNEEVSLFCRPVSNTGANSSDRNKISFTFYGELSDPGVQVSRFTSDFY